MGNRNATGAAAKPAAATSLPKRVRVLGATGSIGASTLDLVSRESARLQDRGAHGAK